MAEAAGNLTTNGKITLIGANGSVTVISGWADVDISSIGLTHEGNVIEQPNGLGNTRGTAVLNERDRVNITFYPLPASLDAAGYSGLDLPPAGVTVTVANKVAPNSPAAALAPNYAGQLAGRLRGDFLYLTGGSISQTADGAAVWNLPCVRFGPAFGT